MVKSPNLEQLKKYNSLLEEIFNEAIKIRDSSLEYHKSLDVLNGEMLADSATAELFIGDVWDGFIYKKTMMEKYDWDIGAYFNMVANVNVYFIDGQEHILFKGESHIEIDTQKTKELVENGVVHIIEFKNNLGI